MLTCNPQQWRAVPGNDQPYVYKQTTQTEWAISDKTKQIQVDIWILHMATKQQSGRTVPSSGRASVRPVYEEFRPYSEWKQDDQSVVLLVHLPGFTKEQIRVFIEGTNTLRVRGERLVGGNKWSRFDEEFRVPGECNIPAIRGTFAAGTLTITMPKKSPSSSQVEPRQAAKTTQETPTTTSGAEKKADDKSVQPPPGPRETASTTRNQKGRDNIPPEITSSIIGDGKQKDGKVTEEPTARIQTGRGESKTPIKTNSREVGEKQTDGKVVWPIETVETKEKGEGQGGKLADSEIRNIGLEKVAQEEEKTRGRGKESIDFEPENTIKRIAKNENEEGEGTASVGKERTGVEEKQPTMSSGSGRGPAGGDFKVEKYKKAMMEQIGRGNLAEERQLLVNIGTAVLVIVALGAYISYTWSSFGKPED
ncbi:hypothetical protein U1Q18_015527 [Sarracenia purpurea var. burkii]